MDTHQVNESRLRASRLKNDVDQLRADLRAVQERADEALRSLDNGFRPAGMGSTILGQAARDVESRAMRISTFLELAFEHDLISREQAVAAITGKSIPPK